MCVMGGCWGGLNFEGGIGGMGFVCAVRTSISPALVCDSGDAFLSTRSIGAWDRCSSIAAVPLWWWDKCGDGKELGYFEYMLELKGCDVDGRV